MGLPIGLGLAWLAFDAIFKEGELVDDYYGIVVEGEKSFQKKSSHYLENMRWVNFFESPC